MADTPPASLIQIEKTQFAVLLFTDICDSTTLKAKHGAMAYKAAAELHNALVERLAAEEHLTLIKNTGDGYFARTTSVAAAVRFALCLQYHLRTMPWPSFPLTTRVGIHAGEVADITTLGQADVLAPAADLVARVMSLAAGGQILLTRSPFDEARHFVRAHPDLVGDVSLTWLAHGPYLFKGCEEPIEVFEVGLSGCAPLVAPPDGEKARRALRPGDEETLGWRPAEGLEIPGRPGWRIAGKLGAGGFGEVWAGERDKTHERRAYKFCFDAERLRALKREVTLTRLLRETLGERDDIVRIFDLRLDEPPYFLESELATDGNLLQWAEKQGGLAVIPLADRIELVAATATALAAAHSVGVLHKDIKPTNVLIFTGKDGRSRPRLVDFGIGTLADTSVLAQYGITGAGFTGATIQHSSGTPTYSPPEYLAGRPFTVQGDVYSLGVMLWQLVTAKADAPLAEGWQRDVPDELLREDISLCVDGDPARRLPSAAELTTRLRALGERRAELTRQRETAAAEQTRRKRQRTLSFATAAAVLIAAVTIPLLLWALGEKERAIAARDAATKAEAKALAAKDAATAAEAEASRQRELAEQDKLTALTAKQKATEARTAADGVVNFMQYDLRDSLGKLGRLDLMKSINDRIARYHEEHPSDSTDPTAKAKAEREQSAMLHQRGDIARAAGQLAAALENYRKSLEIGERLAKQNPGNAQWQRDLTISYNKVGDIQSAQGDNAAALENYRKRLEIGARLAKQDPGNAEWQRDLTISYNKVGSIQSAQGDNAAALENYRKSLEIRERLAKQDPGNAEWQRDLTISYHNVGGIQSAQGDNAAALENYLKSLEIGGRLAKQNPGNAQWQRDLTISYNKVGGIQSAQGDKTAALENYRKSLEVGERLAKQDPGNAEWQRDLTFSYNNVGGIQSVQGDNAAALENYRKSLEIGERLARQDPGNVQWQHDLGFVYQEVAEAQKAQGDNAAALENYRKSLEISERLANKDPGIAEWQIDVADAKGRTSAMLIELPKGDKKEAARLIQEGLQRLEELKKRFRPDAYSNRVQTYLTNLQRKL